MYPACLKYRERLIDEAQLASSDLTVQILHSDSEQFKNEARKSIKRLLHFRKFLRKMK